jgi:bifunctional non-homologous end joining protein LigD
MTELKPNEIPLPTSIKPMLARLLREPFNSPDWIYELKWEGFRTVAFIEGGKVRLQSRNSKTMTSQFPEMEGLAEQVEADGLAIDGELVCLDEQGRPSIKLMQQRFQRGQGKPGVLPPVSFVAFDLIYLRWESLMGRPLQERKRLLAEVLNPSDSIIISQSVETDGKAFFQATCDLGLEGVVAKQKASLYLPGKRTWSWLKVKSVREGEFVIGGYAFGGQRKDYFSSLLLGLHDEDGKLVYVGSAGSGYSEDEVREIFGTLEPSRINDRPFVNTPEVQEKYIHWCKPELVCQVEYGEFTVDGWLPTLSM